VNVLQHINAAMTAVVARVQPSLVQISSGRHGKGAGIIWEANGLIITNAHVARRQTLHVTLANRQTLPAHVLFTDPEHDLAALSVTAHGLVPIAPGNSWPPRPGQLVLALGHPWGVVGAVTAGIVITLGPSPELPHVRGDLIQASLHLRPGHSGGPLVDVHGHLLGINTMMAGPDVGLAIPLPRVQDFLARAREKISFTP
jgi:serine protease Do